MNIVRGHANELSRSCKRIIEVMRIIGLWLYTSGYHFPRDHVRIFHPLKLKTMWHVRTTNHDEALQGSAAKGQILSFTDATGYLT